jgi:hypothetical protein
MISILIYIALFLFFAGIITICVLSHLCFNDTDADLFWTDNYSISECPHNTITDVVEDAFANYELVASYCMDCGARLTERQDGF